MKRAFIIIIIFFINSCKKNIPLPNNNSIIVSNLDTIIDLKSSKFSNIKLQDTIIVDENYYGTIDFNMDIDSIEFSTILYRNMIFFSSMNNTSSSFNEIGKTANSAAIIDSLQQGIFTFKFKVNSKKLGVNKVKIAIEDKIYIKSLNDSIPLNSRYYSIEIPIYVIDSI